MANDDWKERVGIKINLSSDSSEDEEVNKYEEDWKGNHLSPQHDSTEGSMDGGQLLLDDILNEYGEYGTTPPRTRISRRMRQRKQKEKEDEIKKSPKTIQARTKRRNTLDSLYFCELLERSENNPQDQQEDEQQQPVENTKRNKRSIKLLRGSERDLKLDIGVPEYMSTLESEDRAESMPPLVPQMAMKVETCNRFMSLTSKLVACKQLAKCTEVSKETSGCPEERINFYNTFSKLIRMGSNDKQADKNPRRHLSREEHLWQNELKDLIWLELQAWHADRTPTEQDEYLCKAREQVGDLLGDIVSYKFEKRALLMPQQNGETLGPLSTQSSDSGVSADGREDCCDLNSATKKCVCTGCLSMYCLSCIEIQNQALRNVEQLLNRLEAAEALYPSSKAFANQHPLYKCPDFTGRVKAMCLWYNMTKHHRLTMKIIGKLMYLHQPKNCSWPPVGHLSEDDPTTSSGVATDTSDDTSYQDLHNVSRTGSLDRKSHLQLRSRTVQFDLDSSSPSDSNNSNVSHGTNITSSSSEGPVEFSENIDDYYNICTISNMSQSFCTYKSSSNPYRKYMEEVLKTRGLKKAIYFLEKLHKHILHKAMITLQRPITKADEKTEESLKETCSLDTDKTDTGEEQQAEEEEEAELCRYGYWSKEAQSLSLPSYRSAFLFLSRIPFEMIHEFLRMRLEQKPHHPSVLSIRQLMRELKEGLRIAVIHKQRYIQLTQAALWNVDKVTSNSPETAVEEFDQSMKKVLEVYLDYVRQWVLMVQQEGYRKNLLEEEWCFVRTTCPKIPGGEGLASDTFCLIASSMLQAIVDYLLLRTEQLNQHIFSGGELSDDESSPKQLMLLVCREFQSLFNETREKSLKAICFSKMLRKDLEEGNFGQGISTECKIIINNSLEELKNKTLTLRDAVMSTIRVAEETCDVRDMSEVDEVDKVALVSRCREILHQSYKFGFEYHKEVCRLVTGDARHKLARGMISFAQQWMHFVKERCERGRGLRPRWANQGLDFLMTVCEPQNTQYLVDAEFEELKKNIDDCISHVIGTATPNNHSPQFMNSRPSLEHHYPRSRGSSPVPHSRSKTPSYRASRSQSEATSPQAAAPTQRSLSAQNSQCSGESPSEQGDEQIDGVLAHTITVPTRGFSRRARVEQAIKELERELEKMLRTQELIGSVTDIESEDKIHIRSRSVTFSWQRGIKIGQGRFGKVYTAVNNETGELMAVKEIQLQPNDHRTIRRIAEELRIFEGIHHNNLIRYYGVEIHREEMLIFMEFCAEGTLESLVAATESWLPEVLIRRYTQQLLRAVVTLHQHGVVHRDIKSANIFLTDEGNCLKLGDFGSAVKIKAHTTMPGELQGFVGTQAYMAPEVFMKTNTEGHGRAADVWSVGCVVVEMASGKRPWAEYDSNYQIMFKVGMGETPPVPESLSEEGHQFLDQCLQHDPRKRATAANLLHHTFVKVDEDEECSALPSVLEDFLALSKNTKLK